LGLLTGPLLVFQAQLEIADSHSPVEMSDQHALADELGELTGQGELPAHDRCQADGKLVQDQGR
jgi:hypothetical protein